MIMKPIGGNRSSLHKTKKTEGKREKGGQHGKELSMEKTRYHRLGKHGDRVAKNLAKALSGIVVWVQSKKNRTARSC